MIRLGFEQFKRFYFRQHRLHARLRAFSARSKAVAAVIGFLFRAGKSNQAKWLARRLHYLPEIVALELPGIRPPRRIRMHTCSGRDQVAVIGYLRPWGEFEYPLQHWVACLSARGGVFLDVGANTGLYSLLATAASPSLRVFAFEPFPPVAGLLAANLALNGVEGRVRIVPKAVGESEGELDLYIPTDEHGLVETSASLDPAFKTAWMGKIKAAVVSLDAFAAGEALDRVDLIKLDVEGVEEKALRGAQGILGRHRPLVFAELLPGAKTAVIQQVLDATDYVSIALGRNIEPQDKLAPREGSPNQMLCPREKLPEILALAPSVTG